MASGVRTSWLTPVTQRLRASSLRRITALAALMLSPTARSEPVRRTCTGLLRASSSIASIMGATSLTTRRFDTAYTRNSTRASTKKMSMTYKGILATLLWGR